MFTNSSSLKNFKELSQSILCEYEDLSKTFQNFQAKEKLNCLDGCSRCCFKPEIYCSPIELLPLALDLLERGEAEAVYARCLEKSHERCMFLNVTSEEKFQGHCTEYAFRPIICRSFGVSARRGKKDELEYSICNTIKEERAEAFRKLLEKNYDRNHVDLPYIDNAKNHLMTLDPRFLEEEHTINQSLKIILEKVLLYAAYAE